MRPIFYYCVLPVIFFLLPGNNSQAQTFGTTASAIWLTNCTQSNYYNTSGSGGGLIGTAGNTFTNTNLGVYTQNSASLVLRGAEVRTFKTPAVSNVCAVRMFYRIYLASATPGSFSSMDLPWVNDCNISTSTYPSGGSCAAGDQKWNRVVANGTTTPYAPVNLTAFPAGNYVLEVYYEVDGSSTSTTLCNETVTLNNSGSNYKAYFSLQTPVLGSSNPTSCNGTEGSITISGLVAGVTYSVTYSREGVLVGPANFVANSSGQIIISGLDAGTYADISIVVNGCTTDFNTELTLSNYLITPTFNSFGPICAGSTAPILPTTSNNGIPGTWSPSTVDNMNSGSYTFTPTPGQCGKTIIKNIVVNQKVTPTFSFGTTMTICSGATVPALATTSTNSITGTWSPAAIDNQNSAVYTFTPSAGQCANPTTLTVTVNPTVTPTFSFGSSLSICAGATVPVLSTTSSNGITGTWSPSTVDNQASGTYTFTPTAGQCATTTTYTVTVTPNTTPTFSFGTSLTICSGGTVPTLPSTSNNAVTGSWSPSTVSNTTSATYTFTPTAGQCALSATFTVTVNPNITPTFSFGTSLTVCSGGSVPALPGVSTNSITGTWSPASVNNTTSGTYTFTPSAGQCATTATFTVTVNPNITPVFSFGTSLTICSGGTVPSLPATSSNGISGSWSPATVDNTTSGSYTFTPSAGQCAVSATFTVTVNSNTTPTFSFGTTLTICSGGTVPTLPATSLNGVSGSWSPSIVSNTTTASYVFTPTAGQCAVTAIFNVTVNPNITPTFSFGTSLTICSGGSVPALPGTSSNSINGTWSPATVSNTSSATYTFTPTAGQCATSATFTVNVNPNITPTFTYGTSLSVCSGGTVPALASSSIEGITGTWGPSSVSNTTSGVYTFTPTAGQCAVTATFSVTVGSNTTPVFSFGTSLSVCSGGTVPSLPNTSSNGVSGTWNPATVSNTSSATYTFTPGAGQCAVSTTFTVTVNPNITPTFTFGTSLTICNGGSVPSLPGTSSNSITGTWSPATVDNTTSGSYTFTPSAGQCATTATFTVTVNPNVTPTFAFGTSLSICSGGSVPALTNTSNEGLTGSWSPSTVSNTTSGTYTFTPTAGQCATTATFTVTVGSNTVPAFSFGTSLSICSGGSVPALPATSLNGVSGTWSPATVSNTTSGTYNFTPSAGQCATTASFTVTINANITPSFSFGTSLSVCSGGTVPALPATSLNGITGSWNPASVDNTNSGTYTFTPSSGQCALTATFTVTVNPNVTPTFSFGTSLSVCSGGTVPVLSATSSNGIAGTWSPTSVSNTSSGTYTFTPTAGQCATTTTFTVTVNPNTNPTFSFGTSLSICSGGTVPSLPATSDNAVTGSWSPATVSNTASGTYTFTPSAGQCALSVSFVVTVNPILTPTFSFGTSLSICDGASAPSLPVTSNNGVAGSWSPSSIDNHTSGSYTFTPAGGQCAVQTTLNVTVNPVVTPTFSFGTSLTICSGTTVPSLPATSSNNVAGAWSPSSVNNSTSGTYTFTPTAGQCANTTTLTVTVNPTTVPTFAFGTSLSVCKGSAVPALPATSDNGVNGTWNPATVDNQVSGVYTFTPQILPGQCVATTTFTVTVNPVVTPAFSFGNSQVVCEGSTAPLLPSTSTNGITGTWSPSVVSNQVSGTYTFTTNAGQCADPTVMFTVTVNPLPSANPIPDTTVIDGSLVPTFVASGTPSSININWTNSNPGIGLPPAGIGYVPSFVATNSGSNTASATITVVPVLNGCTGSPVKYKINVVPLDKDVFVPNVFSPNADGKNDVLYVYGNYIDKMEMHIFNQWGQQIKVITSLSEGWDGKYKGKPQPVGVYAYTLRVVLSGGRTISMKGNITLLR
jgi:large repetitive protein